MTDKERLKFERKVIKEELREMKFEQAYGSIYLAPLVKEQQELKPLYDMYRKEKKESSHAFIMGMIYLLCAITLLIVGVFTHIPLVLVASICCLLLSMSMDNSSKINDIKTQMLAEKIVYFADGKTKKKLANKLRSEK